MLLRDLVPAKFESDVIQKMVKRHEIKDIPIRSFESDVIQKMVKLRRNRDKVLSSLRVM